MATGQEAKARILVVDDDPKIRWVVRQGLEDDTCVVSEAEDGLEAVERFENDRPDMILMDIKMPGMDGLEAMKRIKEKDPGAPVVVLSAYPDSKIIVQAMKTGAVDFLIKPFDIDMVKMTIAKTLEQQGLLREVRELREKLDGRSPFDSLIGESRCMLDVKRQIEQVADSELNILIEGESGTGKEIVARLLHKLSPRREKAFVKVNCAALPENLLESELFGYEKGAFTGAVGSKVGRFDLADGGVIFLDEIGEMPLALQAKLLQVLEHKEFFRVGGKKNIKVDVRIISATNIDMNRNIEDKQFRNDLYFRLNDATISLPPLRSRMEDLPLLFDHFARKYAKEYGKEAQEITSKILQDLSTYNWPGNVRELESFVKRMVVLGYDIAYRQLAGTGAFSVPNVPGTASHAAASPPVQTAPKQEEESANPKAPAQQKDDDRFSLKKVVEHAVTEAETRVIRRALERTKWNKKKAAALLEISYRSLLYKIKEYGL